MDGWMDGWMHGCMDAWMDGWMDSGISGYPKQPQRRPDHSWLPGAENA